MSIDNPAPFFIVIPLLALFSWFLSRHVAILDEVPAGHQHTLALDGLRGILAASVMFGHARVTYSYFRTRLWETPPSHFYAQLGPIAVTLFFFLSGFLFWRKMLRAPDSIRVSRLLPNRVRRIVPAYTAAIFVFFLFVGVVSHFRMREPAGKIVMEAGQWLTCNIPFGPYDINGIAANPVNGGIFWTLRQEWLFYLALPALVWFRPGGRLLLLVLGSYVVSRGLQILSFHITQSDAGLALRAVMMLTLFFYELATIFIVGMAAAYHAHKPHWQRVARNPAMTIVVVLLLVYLLCWGPADSTWRESILIAPIFFIIACGNSLHGLLTSRPARCLGTISYSFYIFHGLVLFACVHALNFLFPVARMSPLVYWTVVLAVGLVVVLASTLSYRYIEKPFFTRAEKKARIAQAA